MGYSPIPFFYSNMVSQLLLDFKSSKTGKSFEIKDISLYNADGPVSCGTLKITAPGYDRKPKYYDVLKGFILNVNMSNLGLQKVSHFDNLREIPDGAYHIRYSINPNDKVFVEYVYFNTYNINKLYVDKVAEFLEEKCDMTQPQKKERIDQLWEISNSIDLCKTAAEDCRSLKEAELLYNEAVDLLNKMNDKC
jgi:hypothetical protein